jgi:NAD(P)H dehydrogenase (quinone)
VSPRIAVVDYSATGNVHMLAEAIAEGAVDTRAEVRFRRVPELAPDAQCISEPEIAPHREPEAVERE